MKTYISPDIKWVHFKKIWNSVEDSGPTPIHLSKIVWQLLKEKRLYISLGKDDLYFSLNPPKGEIKLITSL